ncbi:MAG: type II toxin-antitoxin system HicB family antitoxin [Candidatus Sungbacteria bacterium]|uniref:Type II toxin-antitoxin system HicB family antitoxin n=1 Tax=Candidatus Sungiibacteriota bacterium TaxID=2750080 RepID=A0A9D6LN44_9BACT|nr:type II toxin-antitoxin system HicB family antitoxin [Candidatus Sungbacteria bacterium]
MKKSGGKKLSKFSIDLDREEDGRWIAEVPKVPGAMAYGNTKQEAVRRAYAIALRTLADSIEQGHTPVIVSRLLEHAMARR